MSPYLVVRSIRGLASKMGLGIEYDWMYSDFSRVTHAQDFNAHVRIGTDAIRFEPVRTLEEFQESVRASYDALVTARQRVSANDTFVLTA